jgi:glycosyltransferase involved in cell wall biosynthesis
MQAARADVPHVAMTDGTLSSEMALSGLHRTVRRRVYRRSRAFVGASDGSFALYRSYGISATSMFKSHLCADNGRFADVDAGGRSFDFIFCGRFAAGKLPLFAIEVAASASRRLGRKTRLLMVGAGPLEANARASAGANAASLDCEFAGFATQEELPRHYARARLMLFPTQGDTWGVVANEACAAGLPVLVSPQAGAAGELIRDGENGRVLKLDVDTWAAAATAILSDEVTWRWMSARGRELVAPYTYANAAAGLLAALVHATQSR